MYYHSLNINESAGDNMWKNALAVGALMFLVGCAGEPEHFGHEPRISNIPEYEAAGLDQDKINIHDCIYDAISESMKTNTVAWWDSPPNNCAMNLPYRGRLIVKIVEPGISHLCIQAIEYSQTHHKTKGWGKYEAGEFVACQNNERQTGRWLITRDLDFLDRVLLYEILTTSRETR